MYCIIKRIVQGKQARVKNADLRHPSCTVVMQKRKSASPVLNVLSVFFLLYSGPPILFVADCCPFCHPLIELT